MADKVSDDQQFNEILNPSTLVLNTMGVGTFVVFFFFLTIGFVWFFSTACLPLDKTLWRSISVFLFIVILLVLMFAPRQNKFTLDNYVPSVYDHAIIPRIAVSLVMIIFGIVSGALLVGHLGEPIELNNVEQESSALWQEEH